MNSRQKALTMTFLATAFLMVGCMPATRPGGSTRVAGPRAPGVISAVPNSQTIPWSELLAVVDHKIAISLSGAYLKGEARAVTPEALEMKVTETSNPATYPTGPVIIPRAQVSSLLVWTTTRREESVGEQTAATAAAAGGILGAAGLSGGSGSTGAALARMGIGLGGAVLGAVIGRELDEYEVYSVIHIAPESETRGGLRGEVGEVLRPPATGLQSQR